MEIYGEWPISLICVRTQLFAFLRIQVGCVALILADQILGQSSFKNDEVFVPSSVGLLLSVLNTFQIVRPAKRNPQEVNDHPGHLFSVGDP